MLDVPPADRRRVAVIAHVHPSISKGGAEIAAYALFRGLLAVGIDAIFIAGCAESDRGRLHLGGPREHAVFHEHLRYDHFYHPGAPAVARDLARLLMAEGVGLANFHHYLYLGLGALRFAKLVAGATTVLTLHEYLAICNHHGQMVTRPGRALCEMATPVACGECFPEIDRMQFVLRRDRFLDALDGCDGYVSPSHFLIERYAAWGLDRARIAMIENGLLGFDAARYPASPRKRPPGSPWVFGYFGQINQFKGVDVLLRACEAIAARPAMAQTLQLRVHGNIVGQPADFVAKFQEALTAYPFLIYVGPYVNSQVRELMVACDYVLSPSTWWENSPLVIQEAFAAGRPVIASGIGGLAEKVQDGVTGLHIRPGDAADFVRGLTQAMDENTYAGLCARLPVPIDEQEMARRYLTAFEAAHVHAGHAAGAFLPAPEIEPVPPTEASLPRRRGARGRASAA